MLEGWRADDRYPFHYLLFTHRRYFLLGKLCPGLRCSNCNFHFACSTLNRLSIMVAEKNIHPDYDHPHVADLVNEAISQLAPFAALILTVILVIFFLVRYYLFESFLMRKCYGSKYLNLNEVNRRGFVNHHIAGMTKIIMAAVGAYPFIDVTFGTAGVHTPYAGSKTVTLGDGTFLFSEIAKTAVFTA